MNKLKLSSLVISLIILICYFCFFSVQSISKSSECYLEKIENLISENKDSEIENIFREFEDFWSKKSKILGMIVHHEHLDNIDYEISELSSYVNQKDIQNIEKSCKCTKSRFKNLREASEFSIENII